VGLHVDITAHCIVSRDSVVDSDWLRATDWCHGYDRIILDAGRGHWRRVLCHSASSAIRHVERTDKLRAASVALPGTEQRRSAARLTRHRRRSSDVRRQRMARFYQGIWSPAHQHSGRPRPTPRILLAGFTDVRWTVRCCRWWTVQ